MLHFSYQFVALQVEREINQQSILLSGILASCSVASFLFFLFSDVLGSIQAEPNKEGCDVNEVDQYTSKMLVFLSKETIPVNATDLAAECE